jgi:hypothetical protein
MFASDDQEGSNTAIGSLFEGSCCLEAIVIHTSLLVCTEKNILGIFIRHIMRQH